MTTSRTDLEKFIACLKEQLMKQVELTDNIEVKTALVTTATAIIDAERVTIERGMLEHTDEQLH